MNKRELFLLWAPEDGAWSAWAKPVLFAAQAGPNSTQHEEQWKAARELVRGAWTPPPPADTLLIFDLPGVEALAMGLDCARHGYRPVPLFNSCIGPAAVVDNEPIRCGLELGAEEVQTARLAREAAPLFMLDSKRMSGSPSAGKFDNRWFVFPQDLPSTNLLLSRGLRRVVLVQRGATRPAQDLAHVLLRWQRGGLAILAVDLAQEPAGAAAPTPIQVARPSLFRALAYRVLATLKLRRNAAGGFGAAIPLASVGGGHGFA